MFDAEVSKMQALRHTNAVVRMSAAPGGTRTRGGGTSCSSHLGGPGEQSGATKRPLWRPWRPPECPDVHGRDGSDDYTIPGGGVRGMVRGFIKNLINV